MLKRYFGKVIFEHTAAFHVKNLDHKEFIQNMSIFNTVSRNPELLYTDRKNVKMPTIASYSTAKLKKIPLLICLPELERVTKRGIRNKK